MKEQDCQILIAIYEEQNVTKAAERLFISQPALTYRLRQIETEYEIRIINRNKNNISFTPEGEYLVQFARQLILEINETKDYIHQIKDEAHGSLKVGVSSNFGLYKLPPIIHGFIKANPKVQVKVNSSWSSEIVRILDKNQIHVGIVTGDYPWYDEKHLLYTDPLTIIYNQPINLNELHMLPRINYRPNSITHNSQKTSTPLTKLVEKWWHDNIEFPPFVSMEVDKAETCKAMVKSNLGYSILPKSCLTGNDDFYQHDLHSEHGLPIMRKTWMLYRQSSLKLSSVSYFVEHMKKAI
ncbi:LysR family transcriptional regulator [Virgibacillus halodenitrificans]|nr:LysR family transcriptional regulator [Virgibacillus halodenitrificans]